MWIIRNEQMSFWDVDGTLILPLNEKTESLGRTVEVFDNIETKFIKMVAHEPMIRLLKEEASRGAYVIVWSRGGFEWAHSVIVALKLEECVKIIMSKPMVYFDDVPIEQWLTYRVYLEPTMQYKTDNLTNKEK